MKTPLFYFLLCMMVLTPVLYGSESNRTANYFLTSPTNFDGKSITVDVAFVRPQSWKSPYPEYAFFVAITHDRLTRKTGGPILVMVDATEAQNFAKKYGTEFKGRNFSTALQGTFGTCPAGVRRNDSWMIDTTGKAGSLTKQN